MVVPRERSLEYCHIGAEGARVLAASLVKHCPAVREIKYACSQLARNSVLLVWLSGLTLGAACYVICVTYCRCAQPGEQHSRR